MLWNRLAEDGVAREGWNREGERKETEQVTVETLAFRVDSRCGGTCVWVCVCMRAHTSVSQCVCCTRVPATQPCGCGTHAPPPISPSYLCERHARTHTRICRHLYSTLVSKLPKTTLGMCTLATPGFSRGESDKHLVEERPVFLDNLEQPGFESEHNPPQPVESRQSKVDNLSYLHV